MFGSERSWEILLLEVEEARAAVSHIAGDTIEVKVTPAIYSHYHKQSLHVVEKPRDVAYCLDIFWQSVVASA